MGLVGAQTLSARVYFQAMRREYAEFLRDANTTNTKGDELYAIYEKTDEGPPMMIASADTTVAFAGECVMGTGGNGGAGAGGAGTGGATSGPTGSGGTGLEAAADGGDGGGCGCRLAGDARGEGLAAGLLLTSIAAMRRRRRPRCP